MARDYPRDREGLLALYGVGRSKLENGDAFLEIIGEHCRKGTFTPVGAL